jgi:hypothetical protein
MDGEHQNGIDEDDGELAEIEGESSDDYSD